MEEVEYLEGQTIKLWEGGEYIWRGRLVGEVEYLEGQTIRCMVEWSILRNKPLDLWGRSSILKGRPLDMRWRWWSILKERPLIMWGRWSIFHSQREGLQVWHLSCAKKITIAVFDIRGVQESCHQ